jgi:hypothetical protein
MQFIQSPDGDSSLVELSLSILNDSYKLPVCLLYPAPSIACGCIFIALRFLNRKVKYDLVSFQENQSSSKHCFWFEIFGCSLKTLECIVHELLELFESEKLDEEKGVFVTLNQIIK